MLRLLFAGCILWKQPDQRWTNNDGSEWVRNLLDEDDEAGRDADLDADRHSIPPIQCTEPPVPWQVGLVRQCICTSPIYGK